MTELETDFTIKFELIDNETGERFTSESALNFYDGLFDKKTDLIGQQLICFLRQAGYSMPNDNLLMESLTDEEYDVVICALDTFRNKRKNTYDPEVSILLCNNEEE